MRKHGARIKHKEVHSPTMVAMMLAPEVSIAERLAVMALTQDYAKNTHYNILWDCHAMLVFGSDGKNESSLAAIIELSQIALENMRIRWEETDKVRATGDELAALNAMVDYSDEFWKRQGGKRFDEAYQHVTRCRELYREQEKAA